VDGSISIDFGVTGVRHRRWSDFGIDPQHDLAPVISNDGVIFNPSDDAASPGSVLNSFDRSFRILTIGGGGGHGMIPAVILEEVERRSARSISSMFQPREKISATIGDVWERLDEPLHDVNELAYVLHDHLGDLRLNYALTELFVYASTSGSRTPEVLGSVGSSIPGTRGYARVRMYQAATASASVPFFGPYRLWRQPDDPIKVDMPLDGPSIYMPSTGRGTTSTSSTVATPDSATRRSSHCTRRLT
jgi:hypothetical protein